MLQPAAFIPPCLPPHLCLPRFLASLSPSARVHISGYLHFYSSTHSCEEHFESTSWRLQLFCFDNYPCRHKFSCNAAVMSLFSFHCDGKRKGPFCKTYVTLKEKLHYSQHVHLSAAEFVLRLAYLTPKTLTDGPIPWRLWLETRNLKSNEKYLKAAKYAHQG